MFLKRAVSAELPVVDIDNANYSLSLPVNVSRGGFVLSWGAACRYGWHDFEITTIRKKRKLQNQKHFCRTCGYTVYT